MLMPTWATFTVFAIASLALLVIPGPAVMYIVTRSVDEGRAAGLASVAGVHLGTVVHVSAAALGISALLASSAEAFTLVKLAGAAYLITIGIRRILVRDSRPADDTLVRAPLRRVVATGVLVNILNPKTALFFLAFLPQFINPARGAVALQVLMLGGLFIALGLVTDGTYALVGSAAGGWLRRRLWRSRGQRLVTGGVYVTLGTAAALTGTPRHG
ncbi:MAG TPA: LysE family translocator [Candidatus Dormibacteraeota bacterium]|jgi:threonine/homoserine/homoserine lactone efflux protein